MNDFTKQQLNHLANSITFIKEKCSMDDKNKSEIEALIKKLEYMIDNYPKCDHRTNRPSFYENGIYYYWCKYCDSKYKLIMKNRECVDYE